MFQDKEGEETDEEDENIPENLAGDKTTGENKGKKCVYIKGGIGKQKGVEKREEREIERKLLICYSATPWEIEFFLL